MTATTEPATPAAVAAARPLNQAPGMTTPAAIGRELLRIRRDPIRALELAAERYDRRPFQLSATGASPTLFINDAAGAKDVLLTNQSDYVKSSQYELLHRMLGHGLVTSEGELWREHRSIVQPHFAKRALAPFALSMAAATREVLDRWGATLSDGDTIDLNEEMSALTLDIVGRALVGTDFSARSSEFARALTGMLDATCVMGRSPITQIAGSFERVGVSRAMRMQPRSNQRMHAAVDVLDEIVLEVIARRRHEAGEHDDLLATLMSYRHPETGRPLSDTEVRDELMTFVTAGHETTANGLSWMWGLLSQHPAARDQLLAEVDTLLGGRTPTADELDRLAWTTACFQESMRLYPPVWMLQRRAKVATVAAGYALPAGAIVSISPWIIHRDPQHWPNPAGYDPRRFIGDAPKRRPRLAFLPFGAGRRMCIGQGFAMMEATIIAAMMSQRYTFDLTPTSRLDTEPGVTLRPRDGLKVFVSRRRPAAAASSGPAIGVPNGATT
ncbi:MAG: cytochrome P450 [Patulibacter sp.]